MSVNSVGANVSQSSLLTSYIEKQALNPAPQPSAQNTVQNASYSAPQVPLQTFQTQTTFPQNSVAQPALAQPCVSLPAAQNSVVQTSVPQAPVTQAPSAPALQAIPVAEVEEPKTDENKAQNHEAKVKNPEGKKEKPSFISKAKELFKNPKAKKIAIGIGAAIVIVSITAFALLSRRKAEVSPELENALWDFVNTVNGFFGRR